MATLQFPANPNDGDSFTASNGVTYTFDATGGTGWTANNPVGIDDEYVNIDGDTMTGDLVLPNLEASGNISADGDIQSTSQNGGQLAGFRNQLINGCLRVAQRGNTGTITADAYTADRWYVYPRTGGQTITWNTGALSGTVGVEPPDATNFLQLQSAAGENGWTLEQRIELTKGAPIPAPFIEDSEWTLSFWAWNQISHNILPVLFLYDSTTDTSSTGVLPLQPSAVMPTGTWTKYVFNYKLNWANIPADFNCLRIKFNGPGDNTQSNTLFTNFQLEPGPVATPFEHRPIGTELALCQRYYLTGWTLGQQLVTNTGAVKRGHASFPQTMRARPTFTTPSANNGTVNNISGSKNNITIKITSATATTDGAINGDWSADAEL